MQRSGVCLILASLVFAAAPVSAGGQDACYAGTVTWVGLGASELWIDDRSDGTWVYRENLLLSGFQPGGNITGVIQDPCGNPMWADHLVAFVPKVS